MGRRDGGERHRVRWPWLWVAVGVVVTLVGAVMTLLVPVTLAEREAYRRARPCEGSATEECVRQAEAVVRDTYLRRRRRGADRHTVVLRVEGRELPEYVQLPDPDLLFEHLDDGREVTVLLWEEERVARIEVPGVGSAETDESPEMTAVEQPVFGVFALAFGGFSVWAGLAGRRGIDKAAIKPGPRGAIGRVLIGLGAGSIVGALLVISLDVYAAWAYYVTTAVATALVWLALRRRVTSG